MCATCGVSHESLKTDAAKWSALPFVGFQLVEADEYGPAESLELRNTRCGSTIAKLVEVQS